MRSSGTFSVAIALVTSGCSSPSGVDPAFPDSSDAASPERAADGSVEAGPTAKPGSDATDVSVARPVEAGANDAGERGDQSSAEAGVDGGSADAGGAGGGGGDSGNAQSVDPESGRLAGITAAHNAVRAKVQTNPPLPPLVWSQTIADYAQQWATSLATSMCAQPAHRTTAELQAKNYGENLAAMAGRSTPASSAQQAVSGWAAEEACWTYGTIRGTEKCDTTCYTNLHSDGCGHYTQVVWRKSTQLGCGVASCQNGSATEDIWICNYAPSGNYIGQAPY